MDEYLIIRTKISEKDKQDFKKLAKTRYLNIGSLTTILIKEFIKENSIKLEELDNV